MLLRLTLANNFIETGLSTFGLGKFSRAGKICILGFALTEAIALFALMMAFLILLV